MINNNSRFEIVYSEGNDATIEMRIIHDKVTGIHYLFAKSGSGAGLTPLLDGDRLPICSILNLRKQL